MAVSPPQWDNLPTGLKELRHWVLWKSVQREGRLTKVPVRADNGFPAEADNQTTWTSYENVKEAFEKGRGKCEGIGFVFSRGAAITGIDLDHCRDPSTGEIDVWAKTYLDRLNSYSEISPSGTGLHVLVRASEGIPKTGEDGGRKKALKGDGYRPDAAIEMYSAKRFFTMTGDVIDEYPRSVEDRQDVLQTIYSEVFGPVKSDGAKANDRGQDAAKDTPVDQDGTTTGTQAAELPDEVVIARMLGSVNANEIEKLLAGDTSGHSGDDSSADLALCNHLAFWTNGNRLQMNRIFRQSKLYRPKWDEKRGRQTYGEMTLDKAIRETPDGYQEPVDESDEVEEDKEISSSSAAGQDGTQDEEETEVGKEAKKTKKTKKGRPSTITLIMRMLLGKFRQDPESRLVISGTGKSYLWITTSTHRQLFDLDSEDFRIWLAGLYADRYKGAILRTSSIRDAKEAIISQLMRIREPVKMDLQVKTIKQGDAIYYDLGNEDWQCVKISPPSVEIVPAPIGLRRTKAQGAQILPDLTAKPEDLDLLTSKMRITEEADKLLVKAIACAGIMPDIAHPILWITGGQGSGKSIRAKMLKSVIDPAVLKQTSLPDNRKDLGVLLSNCHCLVLDNVDSPFTSWQVEMLCQAVTGGASVARELFSDGEIAINVFNRGVFIFTSIGVVTNAPDLLDRAILEPVDDLTEEERRSEVTIMQEFEMDKPKILGAVFESVRRALAILPQVEDEFERGEWPQQRMADFNIFGEALARGAWGKEPGAFLQAYRKRISEAAAEIVGGDLAMSTLQDLMRYRGVWSGTARELLRDLEIAIRCDDPGWQPPSRGWPKTPNALGMKIKKYSTDLLRQGIKIDFLRDKDARTIEIELVARDSPADENEKMRIQQTIEDYERKGTALKTEEFASKNNLDKTEICRIIHSRGWRFDITSRTYSPPYRQ